LSLNLQKRSQKRLLKSLELLAIQEKVLSSSKAELQSVSLTLPGEKKKRRNNRSKREYLQCPKRMGNNNNRKSKTMRKWMILF
jgi:hypothetical protein